MICFWDQDLHTGFFFSSGMFTMFGMAVAEILFLLDEWKHLWGCNPPKKCKQIHGCPWFLVSIFPFHILKNQSNEKQKHCFIPYFSWLKHVQRYFFLANSNEIRFNSWGWLLSTRLNHVEIPMFPW